MLRRQIEAVFEELPPRAVKTGMLFSAENIQIVARFFQNQLSAIGIPDKRRFQPEHPAMDGSSAPSGFQEAAVILSEAKDLAT